MNVIKDAGDLLMNVIKDAGDLLMNVIKDAGDLLGIVNRILCAHDFGYPSSKIRNEVSAAVYDNCYPNCERYKPIEKWDKRLEKLGERLGGKMNCQYREKNGKVVPNAIVFSCFCGIPVDKNESAMDAYIRNKLDSKYLEIVSFGEWL